MMFNIVVILLHFNWLISIFLSQSHISKNKLIEDILFESGILQEVDENYMEQE